MATRKYNRVQTPRQIIRSNLEQSTAKFRTSSQVAHTLQVSEAKVLEWLKNGDMGGLMTRRRWYITPRQLEVILEARANVHRRDRRFDQDGRLCQTNANKVEFVIPGFRWTAQITCDFQQPLGD